MTTCRRLVAGLAAVAAICGAAAGTASAQDLSLPDGCASGAAHVKRSLGVTEPTWVLVDSGLEAYADQPLHGCMKFMVDITVPRDKIVDFDARYDGGLNGWSTGTLPLSKPNCEKYVHYESVYRKGSLASAFTQVAVGSFEGRWISLATGYCVRVLRSGGSADVLGGRVSTWGAFGNMTFRVAVSARINDWEPVRVWAAYSQPIDY